MSMKKRGLGRGLDALLGPSSAAVEAATNAPEGELRQLGVDLIQRGKYQPRQDMHPDALEDLAASIRSQGLVQPIVVRPIGEGRYELIAGERRWRASQIAGLHSIPALIRDVPDEAALAMALIENIQREALNPIEEATALQRLVEEFEMTHARAAEAVGRSRAAVTNLLRLLALHDEVKRLLSHGDIEMGHARALLALPGPQQLEAARMVVAKALSARETERLVQRWVAQKDEAVPKAFALDPNVRRLQDDLSERLGAPVKIHHGQTGKGKLEIPYSSLDELEGILAHIK